jgi:hypothetical protein
MMQVSPGPWDSPAVIMRSAAITTAKLTEPGDREAGPRSGLVARALERLA